MPVICMQHMQPVIKWKTSLFEQVKHIQMKTNGAYLISLKSGNEKSALWRNHVLPHLDDRLRHVAAIRTGARPAFLSLKDGQDCHLADMCIIRVILNKVTCRKVHSAVT